MTMKLAITLVALLWALGAQANTVQLEIGEREVTGHINVNGLSNVRMSNDAIAKGWRLHVGGCSRLGTVNYLCSGGNRRYTVTVPERSFCGSARLRATSGGAVTFHLPSIQDAYWRYKKGRCDCPSGTARKVKPEGSAVWKNEAGYLPEARFVCTNHPDFEEDA